MRASSLFPHNPVEAQAQFQSPAAQPIDVEVIDIDPRQSCHMLARLVGHPHLDGTVYGPRLSDLRRAAPDILGAALHERLLRERHAAEAVGVLVIRGVPMEQVRCVPRRGEPKSVGKPTSVSENLLALFGVVLGHPYGITTEGGSLINDLIPDPEHRRRHTGLGSELELGFHIEHAALRHLGGKNRAPDYLLLTGVSPERNGNPKTCTTDVRLALRLVDPALLSVLWEPLYTLRVPERWSKALGPTVGWTSPVPLLAGTPSNPVVSVAFYPGMVEALTDKARKALEALRAAVEAVAVDHEIAPGSLVLINNQVTLHARRAFSPHFDRQGRASRWVQRLFVANSLEPFAGWAMPESDVLFQPQPE